MGGKMIKYIFTLATLLDFKFEMKKHYSADTVISDLFDEDGAEIYWILSLSYLEIIYGFQIPEELYDRTDLTLGEFAEELDNLPLISDELYPEFYDIKYSAMEQTQRAIELENKTDAESLSEMQIINEKFDELNDRLNVLLGKILVN
jgi:hypothetical protein